MNYEFTEYYDLTGSAIDAAEIFHAERKRAISVWWMFADKIGADSMSHNNNGTVSSILVKLNKEVPDGWRKICIRNGLQECVPHKGRKAGKAIVIEMADLPRVLPYVHVLPKDIRTVLLNKPSSVVFPTCQRLSADRIRYVVSVPRGLNDELKIPDTWSIISEREHAAAFSEHNAAANARNET
jgi:hypothetical protein